MKRGYVIIAVFTLSLFVAGRYGYAVSYQYQVDTVGPNRYAIQVTSSVPQGTGDLFRVLKQKAGEVCVGQYAILQLEPESSRQVFGIIECQNSWTPNQPQVAPQPQQPIQYPRTPNQPIQPQQPVQPSGPQPYNQPNLTYTPFGVSVSHFRWGLGGGMGFLFDDFGKLIAEFAPTIRGTLLYLLRDKIALESALSWWWLMLKYQEEPGEDVDFSLFSLTGGSRYYFSPSFHIDGGLGVFRFAWKDSVKDCDYDYEYQCDTTTISDATSSLGLYGGGGYEIGHFDFTARVHMSKFNFAKIVTLDFLNIGIYATYNF